LLALEAGGNLAAIATNQGAVADAAVTAGATGSLSAKLRSISRDLVSNIVLASGTNVIGHVIVDTAPTTAVTIATAPVLVAGAAIIGKVGIDQTAGQNVISVAASTTDVAVTPTVTASAYTAGNGIGGIMTFASILAATSFNGILQSITAKFKGVAATGSLEVAIFKASPSNGTYTDKTAPTWNAADMANLLGIYTLGVPNSKLGAMTIYNLDGIGKALVGASQSLFAVVIVDGTPTPASTSDFTLELSVLPG
jgi:hypothetical protein